MAASASATAAAWTRRRLEPSRASRARRPGGGGRPSSRRPGPAMAFATASALAFGSAEGRREDEAAIAPQPVEAARQAERGRLPHIALIDLAVIPDLLDDLIGPIGLEAELLAEIVADAQEALDLGIRRGGAHLVDIRGADAELLGGDHGRHGP